MISRKDTVNLSNMAVESEGPHSPADVAPGSWLAKRMASLVDVSEWKVTRFGTTPPVRLAEHVKHTVFTHLLL